MTKKRFHFGFIMLILCIVISGCGSTKEDQKPVEKINIPTFTIESIRVACVGDSITYGSEIINRSKNSYPAQLQSLLKTSAVVENFGVDGACAQKSGNKPYWDQSAFQHSFDFTPDVVILMLGTNDSKTVNWVGEEAFKKDYEALIARYQTLNSQPVIYLMTPSSAYPNADGSLLNGMSTTEIETITRIVKEIAEDKKLTCIDIHEVTKNHKENYLVDGVHPDKEGASRIAQVVHKQLYKDRIKEVLKEVSDWMINTFL